MVPAADVDARVRPLRQEAALAQATVRGLQLRAAPVHQAVGAQGVLVPQPVCAQSSAGEEVQGGRAQVRAGWGSGNVGHSVPALRCILMAGAAVARRCLFRQPVRRCGKRQISHAVQRCSAHLTATLSTLPSRHSVSATSGGGGGAPADGAAATTAAASCAKGASEAAVPPGGGGAAAAAAPSAASSSSTLARLVAGCGTCSSPPAPPVAAASAAAAAAALAQARSTSW